MASPSNELSLTDKVLLAAAALLAFKIFIGGVGAKSDDAEDELDFVDEVEPETLEEADNSDDPIELTNVQQEDTGFRSFQPVATTQEEGPASWQANYSPPASTAPTATLAARPSAVRPKTKARIKKLLAQRKSLQAAVRLSRTKLKAAKQKRRRSLR